MFSLLYIKSNTPILQNVQYMLFDDDDLVDVQLQQEDDTRANTSSVNNEPANVDDALVDVELGQAKTEDMNVDAIEQGDAIKDTAANTTTPPNDVDANTDTPANVVPVNEGEVMLKRRYDEFWQGQYNAGFRPPRRTSQRLAMNNYNRKVNQDYEGQGLTPDEAFDV